MKCIYVLRNGVVVNGTQYRRGILVLEGSREYKDLMRKLESQIMDGYQKGCFGLICDVEDLAEKIKALPTELRPANSLKEDIDEAVARILKDNGINIQPESKGVLKEEIVVNVAHSKEPGQSPPPDQILKVTTNHSKEDLAAVKELADSLASGEVDSANVVLKPRGRKQKTEG